MIYIINDTIHFRSTDALLWLDKDEASGVTLTMTTSRLLAFLIEKQGEVASRDEILSQVWDAHGLRSSNNSLNKYISDLRSIFLNMGFSEEFIVTVPRIGFMFSGSISVQKQVFANHQQNEPTTLTGNTPPKKTLSICIGFLVIMLLLMVKGSTFIGQNINVTVDQKTWPVGSINQCSVFTLTPASTETMHLKLTIVKDILDREKMTCEPEGYIYMQAEERILYGYSGRVFLSICRSTYSPRTQFSSCYNFYETAYEIKK